MSSIVVFLNDLLGEPPVLFDWLYYVVAVYIFLQVVQLIFDLIYIIPNIFRDIINK